MTGFCDRVKSIARKIHLALITPSDEVNGWKNPSSIDYLIDERLLVTGSGAMKELRSNVCIKNIDVYGLNNSSTLHFAKSQNRKHDKLAKDEISLNSADIRLIAGPGQSLNQIQKMVTEMHKQNIPTEKGVVQTIRSERQNVRSLCENIVVHNVQRRSKNLAGQSHLGLVLVKLEKF